MPSWSTLCITFITLIAAFSIAAWIVCKIRRRITFWQEETRKVKEGGYVPPAPHLVHALIMRAFCIIFGFLEVGPIKILGKERLPRSGPTIIAPFHMDAGDASLVSHLLGIRPMYYLIRTTEVQGWRAYMAAATGAIAVDEETQEGRSRAFKAAINAIVNGGPNVCMIIFPQGMLVPDQEVRRLDFKSGTMAIAKIAARKRKEPIWIVPIGTYYRPHEDATIFQRTVEALGLSRFRNLFGHKNYGAIAVVGRPFKVSQKSADLDEVKRGLVLEDDAEKATDMYVERLKILQKVARKCPRS